MVALLVALAVALVVFGVAVAVLRRDQGITPAPPDTGEVGLPTGRPVLAVEVDRLRFGLAFRGYRMSEVDETLNVLRDSLARREQELAALRTPAAPAVAPQEGATVADGGTWPSSS